MVRWFALDTVLVVVSIQCWLSHEFGFENFLYRTMVDSKLIVFLCLATSSAYMIDRWMDGALNAPDMNNRHTIYIERYRWMLCSFVILVGAMLAIFLLLTPIIQLRLMVLGGVFVAYMVLLVMVTIINRRLVRLSSTGFAILKHVIVAACFASAMLVCRPFQVDLLWFWLCVFVLFNLWTHSMIERNQLIESNTINMSQSQWHLFYFKEPMIWFGWAMIIIMSVCLIQLNGLNGMWLGWCGSVVVQLWIMIKPAEFWYECGEVAFACPFIIGYCSQYV